MSRRSIKTSARLVRAASDLDESIAIDPQGMTCTAEPRVTFTDLVTATLRYGLVPIVVPELRNSK